MTIAGRRFPRGFCKQCGKPLAIVKSGQTWRHACAAFFFHHTRTEAVARSPIKDAPYRRLVFEVD